MKLIEPVLYLDPQSQPAGKRCEICGGECYLPSLSCLRCERSPS